MTRLLVVWESVCVVVCSLVRKSLPKAALKY